MKHGSLKVLVQTYIEKQVELFKQNTSTNFRITFFFDVLARLVFDRRIKCLDLIPTSEIWELIRKRHRLVGPSHTTDGHISTFYYILSDVRSLCPPLRLVQVLGGC